MILCATSTSIPSRFSTTVQRSIRVSAISLVSSMEEGLITQTSIVPFPLFFFLIGVILLDADGVACFTVCFGAFVCFGATFFSGFTYSTSSSSSSSSSSFLKKRCFGFSSSRASRSSSSKNSSSSSKSSFKRMASKNLSKTLIFYLLSILFWNNLSHQKYRYQHEP